MWQCEIVTSSTYMYMYGQMYVDDTPKLTLEFDTAKHLGAYQFTSAAMNAASPGGNPTSWTVTCSDQDGDETVLSSVSPMDACTDSVSTGCAPVAPRAAAISCTAAPRTVLSLQGEDDLDLIC